MNYLCAIGLVVERNVANEGNLWFPLTHLPFSTL